MEQMIEIYEDLIEQGCDEQAEAIYEMITETIKNLESADRIEFLKNLVENKDNFEFLNQFNIENKDTFGFLNEFNNWGPDYLESNYLIWESDYPDVPEALNKIFGKGFRYMIERLDEMYYNYCGDCYLADEDEEDILCFESWIENFYEDIACDASSDAWNKFIDDKDLTELYLSTIELLENLGDNGRTYLFERILKIF